MREDFDIQECNIIDTLNRELTHSKLTSLERSRCIRELEIVLGRLTSREYQKSSFLPRNLLTIPDRTDEIFKDLRFFWSVGTIWKELLKAAEVKEIESILDIGCGFFPKVELGLYYLGFKGSLTLVDSCKEALNQAHQFLKFFDVEFKIQKLPTSVWKLPDIRYDLIVANHMIDDLILDAVVKEQGINLMDVYRSEKLFIKLWKEITQNPTFGVALMEELASLIVNHLSDSGTVLFLDYPSFSHRTLKLSEIYRYVSARQRDLRTFLKAEGLESASLLGKGRLQRERLIVNSSHVVYGKKYGKK